jgi:hypothetical protein
MQIEHACKEMMNLAELTHCIVEMKFNDVELIAYPRHGTWDQLARAYQRAAQGEAAHGMRMAFSTGESVPR